MERANCSLGEKRGLGILNQKTPLGFGSEGYNEKIGVQYDYTRKQ